ncbi:hypothetical protein KAM369_02030 [Aeromonas caviae]|nr:hypothetical protein KAM369_02030 [Aeromonas caviae]GJC17150.1 hypothetical protein KAM377_06320 [Aeromonas caviae]GJC26533.1 hypothetical protein KAM376D_10280 [Aeromonas caviae]
MACCFIYDSNHYYNHYNHYNHVIHPDSCRKAYPFARISPPAHGNDFAMR